MEGALRFVASLSALTLFVLPIPRKSPPHRSLPGAAVSD
jgi:hypothetical protein